MSRVTMIQHINIQVSNRDRTREWYEKVLGAEFLDRGPELNKRQLQLRIGSAEIHTSDTADPVRVPSVHFAVEIADWDEMITHLDALALPLPCCFVRLRIAAHRPAVPHRLSGRCPGSPHAPPGRVGRHWRGGHRLVRPESV